MYICVRCLLYCVLPTYALKVDAPKPAAVATEPTSDYEKVLLGEIDPKHAETAQHVEPVCRVHKQQYLIVSSSLELLLVVLLVALHLPIHQLRQVIIVGILLTFLGHKRHLRQVLLTSILLPSLG